MQSCSEILDTLRQRREVLGITQHYLAELSQVSLRTIVMMEQGKGNPSLSTVGKVADVLGLKIKLQISSD